MTRQASILDAIRVYKRLHDGNSPSEAELAEQLGITRQAINKHLTRMEKDGTISRPGKGRRTVRVIAEQLNL